MQTNWLTDSSELWGLIVKLQNTFKHVHTKSMTQEQVTGTSVSFVSSEFCYPKTEQILRRYHCLFKFLTSTGTRKVVFSAVLKVINAPCGMYKDGNCSTNNGRTDKLCSHHISWFCAISNEDLIFFLKKNPQCSKVVCYTKSKAFEIWLNKRGEWISCWENVTNCRG